MAFPRTSSRCFSGERGNEGKEDEQMSIPQSLTVVVVSKSSEIAGIATAVLCRKDIGGYNPLMVAAFVRAGRKKSIFFVAGAQRKIPIVVATPYHLINPGRVDLWLALDTKTEEIVRGHIRRNGPPPDNFYRTQFPDPVVGCGFDVRGIPSTREGMDPWLDYLTEQFKPWKERIWKAYGDSS